MFLCSVSFTLPVVTFTFVDPGLGILDSFKTHLLAYGSLFEALPEVRLVYISPRPTQFEIARKTFLATAGRPPKKDPSDEILRYFRLQKRSEEHTSELQSRFDLVCRLLLEKKKKQRR